MGGEDVDLGLFVEGGRVGGIDPTSTDEANEGGFPISGGLELGALAGASVAAELGKEFVCGDGGTPTNTGCGSALRKRGVAGT